MLFHVVLVPIDLGSSTNAGQIRRIAVDELGPLEWVLHKVANRVVMHQGTEVRVARLPGLDDPQIGIDADALDGWLFVSHHRPSTEVSLDVDGMRRHQVDEPLVTLSFAAWVSHGEIIVRTDDDVKSPNTRGARLFGGLLAASGSQNRRCCCLSTLMHP
ncbi:hypothetical protein [Mitsuaria sp. TWR114]|uniref:hypothetical protein n=1 Tax=Mitsuaria sp. TWR114 TaxID=2601731 RepID=UPI001C9B3738|nr:hypothetical protein [Mitsuaria sp. TWR114]